MPFDTTASRRRRPRHLTGLRAPDPLAGTGAPAIFRLLERVGALHARLSGRRVR